MPTVREHLDAAEQSAEHIALQIGHHPGLAAVFRNIRLARKELDESETAWRKDGSTYRLVADDIEVPDAV